MNDLPVRIEWYIEFFSDEPPLKITEEQHEAIRNLINDFKFIDVNDEQFNVSDIKRIKRVIFKQRPMNERGYYDVD